MISRVATCKERHQVKPSRETRHFWKLSFGTNGARVEDGDVWLFGWKEELRCRQEKNIILDEIV